MLESTRGACKLKSQVVFEQNQAAFWLPEAISIYVSSILTAKLHLNAVANWHQSPPAIEVTLKK